MIELPENYVLAGQINEIIMVITIMNVTVNAFPLAFAWYESLCRHTDEATAERIAHKIPLSKSAD
jgi:hypothetical protein